MKETIKKPQNLWAVFFLFTVGFFSFCSILTSSQLETGNMIKIVRYGIMLIEIVLFFQAILEKKWAIWKIALSIITVGIFSIAALVSDRSYIFIYAIFILNAQFYKLKLEYYMGTALVSCSAALLIILMLCGLGVVPDYIFDPNGRNAHCLGFGYYSAFPFAAYYCTLLYLYLRKHRIHLLECFFLLGINYWLYKLSTLRLVFFLALFFIPLDYLFVKWKRLNLNKCFLRLVSFVSFPIGATITLYSMLRYDANSQIWSGLNELLTGRLKLARQGYLQYGIKLFGNHIEMRGNNAREVTTDYFYIDSGFAYSLLGYGIFFTTLIILLYSVLFRYSCIKNDKVLFVWILSVLAFSMVNNTWITIEYNPVLLFSFASIQKMKQHKRTNKLLLLKMLGT